MDKDGMVYVGQVKRYEEKIKELEAENKRLKEREELLDALEAAGVDNWEGYGYAIEELKGGER